ncbi:MAG: lipoyl(octanoyl) transferase LipB [Pseudomonadota bacterium]|nr:lipoyl(octanoyl) transferase LipB [Pseudomonadota bacterium]
MTDHPVQIIHFDAPQPYEPIYQAMRDYTEVRTPDSPDQLWLLEHLPVLTQGLAGKPEHILHMSNDLPVVKTNRGGQVTWHGIGQLVGYLLFDLNRLGWNVRQLVSVTEYALIDTLAVYGIVAQTRSDAPGVYVDGRKIGSLGFKIRRGCSYHGLSLNIDCALDGFARINPCGHAGLEMVRISDLHRPVPSLQTVATQLSEILMQYYRAERLLP